MSLEDFLIYNALEDEREESERENERDDWDDDSSDDEICEYEEREETRNTNGRGSGRSESGKSVWSRIWEALNGDGVIGCLWAFGQLILIMLFIMYLVRTCDHWIEGRY